VEHFVEQLRQHAGRRLSGVSPQALEILTRHSWPGNVRELRNVIERAIVLGGSSTIEPEDLSLSTVNAGSAVPTATGESPMFRPISLAELEKEHIFHMLDHAHGNKTKASQLLGIERSTLDRKLKRYAKS
jgi:Nif-specific regulatory protein